MVRYNHLTYVYSEKEALRLVNYLKEELKKHGLPTGTKIVTHELNGLENYEVKTTATTRQINDLTDMLNEEGRKKAIRDHAKMNAR